MSQDDDYFLPLEDQRVFGAGIRRKRVPFVRSSEHELHTTSKTAPSAAAPSSGASIADRYLSIVLQKDKKESSSPSPSSTDQNTNTATTPSQPQPPTCEICNLPLASTPEEKPSSHRTSKPHEASLAHQLCLTHSHPPSHLDRSRHGLRYLSSYGWDPDSRIGLGAPGREGIREPLKGKMKADTAGLGADGDSSDGEGATAASLGTTKEKERKIRQRERERVQSKSGKVEKLNAKQVRKGNAEDRRKGEKLRELFYRSEDVIQYLGGG